MNNTGHGKCKSATIHVVGGAAMGLLVSLTILRLKKQLGQSFNVVIYERSKTGGSPTDTCAAGIRCQAWAHDGSLYAFTQPTVAKTLHWSIRELRGLVPLAFQSNLPALALFPPKLLGDDVCYAEVARALGIRFDPISNAVATHLAPSLRRVINSDSRVFMTDESTFNLRILNAGLQKLVLDAGGTFVRGTVTRLERVNDRIAQLILEDQVVTVGPADTVVLSCSSRIPALLEGIVDKHPVQLHQSQLVATEGIDQRVLLEEVMGGATVVPHEFGNRLITILGNSSRKEVTKATNLIGIDDQKMISSVLESALESFGIEPPNNARIRTWTGIKVEVVPAELDHCQSHHTALISELGNCYVAVPGKLSGAPAAASALALQIVSDRLDVGGSIWEEAGLGFAIHGGDGVSRDEIPAGGGLVCSR